MAFWWRVRHSQLRSLSNQLKRCYFQTHGPYFVTNYTRISGIHKPDSVTQLGFCKNVRSFAAPAQFKQKQEEEDDEGPRLNEKITAYTIRLVLDEGHCVISRREALDRAKQLNLDLVEVDRNAKPPVCKIMDYHREKYKKQLKEKERSKSKSEGSLRKGECKSVQFECKIEKKDLQMKADTAKRMMDNGYRVKCVAKSNDKRATANEDQNLPGLLARFCALIEDVSVIESGPIMEKKQAYVIVRHIKYGPSKKGSKKSVLETISNHVETNSDSEADVDPANESPLLGDATPTSFPPETSLEIENRYKKDPRNRSPPSAEMNFANPEAPVEINNRYKDPRNRYPPSTEMNSARPEAPLEINNNRYKKDLRNKSHPSAEANFVSPDPRKLHPQIPYPGRPGPQYPNQGRPTEQYANQGRPTPQHMNQGRPTEQFPNQGRPMPQHMNQGRPTPQHMNQGRSTPQQYPNQGRQIQFDPNNSHQSRETNHFQGESSFIRNSRSPAEELPKQDFVHPGASGSPNSRSGIFNVPKPNGNPESPVVPTQVNRYKKAVNPDSPGSIFHGRPDYNKGGQGR